MPPEPKTAKGADDPVLRLSGLSLAFGGGAAPVLDQIDLSLKSGTFHFLSGASGAGKTSLLRTIYLSQKPSQGEVRLFGESVRHDDRTQMARLRRCMGIVFQDFRLLDHLSVFDNAALPLSVAGQAPGTYREDVIELLVWVGLKDRLDDMPASLSGGEKQRLAVARAVVARPSLILADEPTGNIDRAMGLRVMRLLVELNRLGTTVLVASHDEGLIQALGMPVIEIDGGQLYRRDLTARPKPVTRGSA